MTQIPRNPLPLPAFALAALTPVPLFACGLWLGGGFVWAGFLYMACLAAVLDRLIPHVAGDAVEGQEFPGSDTLLAAVGLSALALLPLVIWAVAGASALTTPERVALFIGCGFWLGQVAHPAAHELIHRPNRWLFRLGVAFYAAILFGQHASAHRLVHHRHVATNLDPNSAPEGMGFYRFAPRAWWGSFRQGWLAEDALRARAKGPRGLHPYAVYMTGSVLALALAWAIAGAAGLLIWAGLGLHVQAQILVSDYVQHYGLRRRIDADGRPQPVGVAHSWNSGPWFSSALMLNAPRHSDHHAHPTRPYPALRLPSPDQAPRLPWPLPVACTIAFFPRLWKRAIRRRLQPWTADDKVTEG
ncbi:MAG: alkane 1-monooxygenase [Paracoccaceae bacterium]